MRNSLVRVLVISFAVTGIAGGASLFAQTTMRFRVPFEFVADQQVFPAGLYEVGTSATADSAVSLRSTDEGWGKFIATRLAASSSEGQSRLIFHRYGSRYFLSQICISATGMRRSMPVSKMERELAAQLKGGKAESVTLAAK